MEFLTWGIGCLLSDRRLGACIWYFSALEGARFPHSVTWVLEFFSHLGPFFHYKCLGYRYSFFRQFMPKPCSTSGKPLAVAFQLIHIMGLSIKSKTWHPCLRQHSSHQSIKMIRDTTPLLLQIPYWRSGSNRSAEFWLGATALLGVKETAIFSFHPRDIPDISFLCLDVCLWVQAVFTNVRLWIISSFNVNDIRASIVEDKYISQGSHSPKILHKVLITNPFIS